MKLNGRHLKFVHLLNINILVAVLHISCSVCAFAELTKICKNKFATNTATIGDRIKWFCLSAVDGNTGLKLR